MAQLALALLGPLQATLDGAPIIGFESRKVRALLVYLALEADRPHGRDALTGLLWPDQPDQAARTNLRQALSNLRQVLGNQRATPPYVQISGTTIQFNRTSNHSIDVAAFTELLDACERHSHRHAESCTSCARRLQQAVDQYHGEFLAGFFLADSAAFEEWALLKREQLHRRAIAALGRLAAYHEQRGEYAPAQQHARRQLELDPWREESHRQLMRVFAVDGQRSAALMQYAMCRRILADELGVAPEAETTALYAQIQGEAAVPNVLPLPTSNLAAHTPLTALIGREAELAQIADRLEQRDCRLLTLVGPGGIGKTRLALQAAIDLRGSFPDGVAFVPLATLSATELIIPAIASALGITFHGSADPKTQLLAYLRRKDLLLVLDNCEHLLDSADVLSDILQATTMVTLLATSREPLHLRAEWLLDIQGLQVPERADAHDLEQSSAVQLFVQTARRVQADFMLSPATVPGIMRICQLVAGTPLAIELAAAWVRSRSCREIAYGLEQSLEQLATTMRDVPARHRSMRAVFDHSWHLLSDTEQSVLRRLSVFRGGMDTEAATQVAGASQLLLAALVDKSLLRCTHAGRFDIHELVRQYAGEQLRASGEVARSRNAHAAYYLQLVEMIEPKLDNAQMAIWLGHLEDEQNNIRVALASTLETGDSTTALRLSGALPAFWDLHGHVHEGRRWLEQALTASAGAPLAVQAKALSAAGQMEHVLGNHLQAQVWVEQSIKHYQALHDQRNIALVSVQLGGILRAQGRYEQAAVFYQHGFDRFQALDDTWGIGIVHIVLGHLAVNHNDLRSARAHYEQGLTLQRAVGAQMWVMSGLEGLVELAFQENEYQRAGVDSEELLALAKELGNREGIVNALNALGRISGHQGDFTRATSYLTESFVRAQELAYPPLLARVLNHQGDVAFAQADFACAHAYYGESLQISHQLNDTVNIATGLECLAGVAGAQADAHRATRLFGAAERLHTQMGIPVRVRDLPCTQRTQQNLAAARAQLDATTFAAAWAAGEALTLEQAIAEALQVAV